MPISPLGGVAGRIHRQILKAITDFLYVFHYNYLLISYRLEVIRHFCFGWDSLFGGQILGVFGA